MCSDTSAAPSTNITQGIHHLGLTVANVEEATAFFIDMLGYSKVGANEAFSAVFVSDGTTMLTLWPTANKEKQRDFDHKNQIGLHHLCIKVESKVAFELLNEKLLTDKNVKIEFGPGQFGATDLQHTICEVLGGIRIEFIAET